MINENLIVWKTPLRKWRLGNIRFCPLKNLYREVKIRLLQSARQNDFHNLISIGSLNPPGVSDGLQTLRGLSDERIRLNL